MYGRDATRKLCLLENKGLQTLRRVGSQENAPTTDRFGCYFDCCGHLCLAHAKLNTGAAFEKSTMDEYYRFVGV